MFRNPQRPDPRTVVADVTAREAHQLARSGRAVILDVRQPDEWEEVRIAGATHIPLGELRVRAAELPRDRTIVVQCRSGSRSFLGAQALAAAGFLDVRNLDGGIQDWLAASLPVERGA